METYPKELLQPELVESRQQTVIDSQSRKSDIKLSQFPSTVNFLIWWKFCCCCCCRDDSSKSKIVKVLNFKSFRKKIKPQIFFPPHQRSKSRSLPKKLTTSVWRLADWPTKVISNWHLGNHLLQAYLRWIIDIFVVWGFIIPSGSLKEVSSYLDRLELAILVPSKH